MRTNINFKGIDSLSFGLNITYLDRRQRAEELIDNQPIPYSNKYHIVHRNKYKPYERVCRGILFDLSQKNTINSWLKGNDILKTSIDPDGFFRASVISSIKWEKIAPGKEQFEVVFIMNPAFHYLDSGMSALILSNPYSVVNPGTNDTEPLMEITGSGNISVDFNGKIFNITALSGTIIIDTELMEVWEDTVLSSKMSGPFPILQVGINNIAWTGTVTQFRLLPRWRNL